MIWSCFYAVKNLPSQLILAVFGNTLATFAIPLLSALFPQKLFLGRLPFRSQSYINFFVFVGSFLHQCTDLGDYINYFDKWLHFFSGFIGVFLGCLLGIKHSNTIRPKHNISRTLEHFLP